MKGIAGVVVLYYPDKAELLNNIQSYLPYLDKLIIIDNTGPEKKIQESIHQLQGAVQYIANTKNEGVAAALNKAASIAYHAGYNWLLTMDQDSCFDKSDITAYFNHFSLMFYKDPSIAIVAPSIHYKVGFGADSAVYEETTSVITSGSLLQLAVWHEVDGFNEQLFIDEVDHEYCYRAYLNGYKIIQFKNISLNHALGTKKEAGYLGTLFYSTRSVHSPARVYFIVRNYLYVRTKYKKLLPEVFRLRDAGLLTILKNNLFFSGHFTKQLKSICKAVIDFRKGNFSEKI